MFRERLYSTAQEYGDMWKLWWWVCPLKNIKEMKACIDYIMTQTMFVTLMDEVHSSCCCT